MLNASPTTVITVRNRLGDWLLEDVGVSQEIHLTADPAFRFDKEELPVDLLRAQGVDVSKRLVGFSVREPGPAAPDIDPDDCFEAGAVSLRWRWLPRLNSRQLPSSEAKA